MVLYVQFAVSVGFCDAGIKCVWRNKWASELHKIALRCMGTSSCFTAIFQRETIFGTSYLLSLAKELLLKGSSPTEKNLLLEDKGGKH